ncbi:hypothetical protein QBC42DRAFT_90424 [Cladorrhinum samala]|uniref:Secreted protein n=1 Tax=Cladorrhinum samala TaxID=585594 RepID=A0AAV9HZ72_9PEZI|nr:hypothetical protein QBC42DRAFT_90424 [Cladorrhinum samala]
MHALSLSLTRALFFIWLFSYFSSILLQLVHFPIFGFSPLPFQPLRRPILPIRPNSFLNQGGRCVVNSVFIFSKAKILTFLFSLPLLP